MALTAPTIDASGISAPTYAEVLEYLQTQYRSIYGADIYLGNDSQDGQFLAILASAINDSNAAAVAVYNSFSPATAQGNGLSSNVKINGISRLVASESTVDLLIVGQAGTVISNGIATDQNDTYNWILPETITIPLAGEITVTATCADSGAIIAQSNTLTKIKTPTFGWQTVNNQSDAVPGNPVESDAELRVRQALSVAVPSQTIFEGIVGSVANVTGVTRIKGYENDTDTVDANGIPAHSIAIIAEGGDAQTIFETIAEKKTPGTGTFGSLSTTIIDAVNSVHIVKFSRPTILDIKVAMTIEPQAGYSASVLPFIKAAVLDFINALEIGESLIYSKLYVPANLSNNALGETYNITALTIAVGAGAPGTANIAVAYNEAAQIIDTDIVITVAP
jgi:uncharacterized phage protein gp47/JayE